MRSHPNLTPQFKVGLVLLLLVSLAACTSAPIGMPAPAAVQPSATRPAAWAPAPTATLPALPTPTRTPKPALTPVSSATLAPTSTPTLAPWLLPAWEPASQATYTPAPAAQCPEAKPQRVLDFQRHSGETFSFAGPVLEFLNAGGTFQAVIYAIHQIERPWTSQTQVRDVTGDGVPELLLSEAIGHFHVFTCRAGQYELHTLLSREATEPGAEIRVVEVRDMNHNGVEDILTTNGSDRERSVAVFEWVGSGFVDLTWIAWPEDAWLEGFPSCSRLLGPSSVESFDLDGNGARELILRQGIPDLTNYGEGLPWREETRICSWNGRSYVWTRNDFSAPIYRFQAVQDADRLTLRGEYDQALKLYQAAVSNDYLEWWSEERWLYEQLKLLGDAPFAPEPDPAEAEYLKAYARFRILLLHVLGGAVPEAQAAYADLQSEASVCGPAQEVAGMAQLFWDSYTASQDIALACQQTYTSPVTLGPLLTYLGAAHHGAQSHIYEPVDVCPFSATPSGDVAPTIGQFP